MAVVNEKKVTTQAVPTPAPAQPTYNEAAPTNYGGKGNVYNELIYAKKSYDAGDKSFGQNYAKKQYEMLDPTEATNIQGMNTQQLIDYVNAKNGGLGGGGGGEDAQNGGQMDSILAQLRAMGEAQYQGQAAQLNASRASRIAELEKAYNDAVASGEMSVREAKDAYDTQVQQINSQAYDDSQNTNVIASARGMGNSQQMLGMQASDNARANTNRTSASTAMQSTVSDIRQRLNAIAMNKNLDVNRANTEYDMALSQARAQADGQYAQGAFDLQREDYAAERDFSNQKEMADIDFGYQKEMLTRETKAQSDLMKQQSGLNISEMKVKLGIDKELGSFMNDLELINMAKQHGYDLDKMKKSFGYDNYLQSARLAHDASEGAKNRSLQASEGSKNRAASAAKSKDDGYGLALQRELNKYKKGTAEYDIVQAQIKQENDRANNQIIANLKNDVATKRILENPNIDLDSINSWGDLQAALNASGASAQANSGSSKATWDAVKSASKDPAFWQTYKDVLNPFKQ